MGYLSSNLSNSSKFELLIKTVMSASHRSLVADDIYSLSAFRVTRVRVSTLLAAYLCRGERV